jgi:hypothetical protein
MKKRKADKEILAQSWTLSKKWRKRNAFRDWISHKIHISKKLEADLNFPKMHLMSDWAEQIRRHRALQQYSAERHNQARKTNLKDGWNDSNHNLNYLPEVFTIQRRILSFEMSELNLQALAQHWENSAAASNVFPSSADLAAPLSSQSYAKRRFMWPQNRRDGKHSDSGVNDVTAFLDNTPDASHHAPIYSGTRECIKHKSCNTTYISDEQLHAMEHCIYHGIKGQVE